MKKLIPNRRLLAALILCLAIPAMAQPLEPLHPTVDGTRDDWGGMLGGQFRVGATNAVVTHLGFYDINGDGLLTDHHVGIFSVDSATTGTLLGSVLVTNGVDVLYTNGYRWVALESPLLLRANTDYVVAAEVFANLGDAAANNDATNNWGWNPVFVGTNGPGTRDARYSGADWPNFPEQSSGFTWGANTIYGAPNLASWPVGPAKGGMADTVVNVTVGDTATILGTANGEAPVAIEWYKSPATLIPGQTNTTLVLPNVQIGDSGEYYLVAKNALGTSQSASATLNVSADPVSIVTSPTNLSVFQNYSATFHVIASGTPPISYQWFRDGTPIADAAQSSYTLSAAGLGDHGAVFSCVTSNNAPGPFTAASDEALLTVVPNAGQPALYMHETIHGQRNNHTGTLGGRFTTGDGDVIVSHLGFYDKDGNGLNVSHYVGVFDTNGTVVAEVQVPSGTTAYLAEGYRWVALDPPLLLTNKTTYTLAAEVTSGDGDGWPDVLNPTQWNPYFVGDNGPDVTVRWSGGGWPTMPDSTWTTGIYGPPNMALLPLGKPVAIANPPAVTQYETLDASFEVTASGQAPVTAQWYKAPSSLLNGQTNSTLNFSSLTLADAGDYYAMLSNAAGFSQTRNVTLSVIEAAPPVITRGPQPASVYVHQTVRLSVEALGLPPLSYEWKYKGSTIPNETNSILALLDVSVSGSSGDYQVIVSNSEGSTPSATATLTVLTPPAGSYMAAVIGAEPLVYYPFSDTIDPFGGTGTNAMNLGTLGAANDGIYEFSCTPSAGPRPVDGFAQFSETNQAVLFDASSDVRLPALNMNTNSGAHVTMAAWLYTYGPQMDWTGILFRRGVSDGGGCGFGLTTDTESSTPNMLEYHWRNEYWEYSSKLFVPDYQWVFVALVVQPDRGSLYLHDGTNLLSATNVAPHGAAAISGDFFIGYDPAAATRRLYGVVDEAMVFDRALSEAELLSLYLGLPPVTLDIGRLGNNVIVTWTGGGTLQRSGAVNGTYTDLTGVTSPYTNTVPVGTNMFYRVKVR